MLAILVAAAIRTERPHLARIGREILGSITAKSAIKRAWRFNCNERSDITEAMAGVIARLVRKRKKRLWVSLGWTETRDSHTLMAAACIGGRAVPLLWFSFPERSSPRGGDESGRGPPGQENDVSLGGYTRDW
jgi:hypothetical protein